MIKLKKVYKKYNNGHVALENIDLVIQDQHGQPLKDAIVELYKATKSERTTLPVAVMDQVHKAFLPDLLVVLKGQQVNFPNSDNIRHHVYSFSQAKPFQLKLYSGQPKEPVIFDQQGVAIRTGHHCAQPVMEFYDIPATARASFAFYNSEEEVDASINAIQKTQELFA